MNLISQDDDDIFSLWRIMLVSESFPKTVAAVGKIKKSVLPNGKSMA